ncbi:MAG TPA: MarR family winged helix-turn-helix transcriptional regulator, partial [Solirubrobacteraceae bacterium]|nr:MarR family winged helix-turn-helix transcriptional regulator [Solirubrobacteraceae bacterium]
DVYLTSFTSALDRVFLVAAIVAAAAFLLSWLLQQRPLRESVQAGAEVGDRIGESFAMPRPPDSLAEISRALSVLLGREGRRHLVEQIAARAGVDLSAAGSWLLARAHREPQTSMEQLCEAYDVPLARGQHALQELIDRGMLVPAGESGGPPYELTDRGRDAAERLIAERQATMNRLLAGWDPEKHAQLEALLTRLADELGHTPADELVKH